VQQLREPSELQVSLAIDAAERESAAWKIEQQPSGKWRVSDVGRMLVPGALPVPITSRDYADVEKLASWSSTTSGAQV
jgi:hypothetical protein